MDDQVGVVDAVEVKDDVVPVPRQGLEQAVQMVGGHQADSLIVVCLRQAHSFGAEGPVGVQNQHHLVVPARHIPVKDSDLAGA
jgi:hypothetical protein